MNTPARRHVNVYLITGLYSVLGTPMDVFGTPGRSFAAKRGDCGEIINGPYGPGHPLENVRYIRCVLH